MSDTLDIADPAAAERLAEELGAGRLAVVPTDTVYAIVADAFAPQATRRLLRARGAGRNRPLPVLVDRPRQISGLTQGVTEAVDRLVAAYWPGPLTIALRAAEGLGWDLGNTAGTVALRQPDDDWLRGVIAEVGPLAATGASRRGRPAATTVEEARTQLGEAVAVYVDGGPRAGRRSTIVDATRGEGVEVLRTGAIDAGDLARVAGGELEWGQRPDDAAPRLEPGGDDAPGDDGSGEASPDDDGPGDDRPGDDEPAANRNDGPGEGARDHDGGDDEVAGEARPATGGARAAEASRTEED